MVRISATIPAGSGEDHGGCSYPPMKRNGETLRETAA